MLHRYHASPTCCHLRPWCSVLLPPPPPPPRAATHHSLLHHVLLPLTSCSPSPLLQVFSPLFFSLGNSCCTLRRILICLLLAYIEFSSVAFLFSSLNLAWISSPWQRHDVLKLFSHPALKQSYQQKLFMHGDRDPIQPTFAYADLTELSLRTNGVVAEPQPSYI